MSPRKEFDLLPADISELDANGYSWEAVLEAGQYWLLIHRFEIPSGYTVSSASVALLIPPTYPDNEINMAYFSVPIIRKDGIAIGATDCKMLIDGKEWQRWSRHRTPHNSWRPGLDNICSHLLLVKNWLEREFINKT